MGCHIPRSRRSVRRIGRCGGRRWGSPRAPGACADAGRPRHRNRRVRRSGPPVDPNPPAGAWPGPDATMPGLLTEPLRVEYRWSRASVGLATSVNMVAYGLVAPFTAAWMDRFGLRRVALVALPSVAVGATLTTLMSQAWQITLYWGLLVGAGTGSLSMTFAATVAQRWFMERHGLVVGALIAVLSAVLAASVLGAGRPGPGHGGDGGGDPGVEGGGVLTGGVGTGRTVGVRGTDRLGSGRAGRSGRGHLGCVRGRVAVVRAAPGARVVRVSGDLRPGGLRGEAVGAAARRRARRLRERAPGRGGGLRRGRSGLRAVGIAGVGLLGGRRDGVVTRPESAEGHGFGQVRVACRGPVGTVLRPDRNPHLGAVPKSLRNPLVTQRNHTYSHLTLVQLGPDQHPPEPRATR